MGEFITSRTHEYVTVKTWPNRYYMKLFHQHTDAVKYKKGADKFYECVDKRIKFDNLFYEYITKKPSENIYTDYLAFRNEAVIEEIREVSGIVIYDDSGSVTYCVPKNDKKDEIIQFIKDNCDLKYNHYMKASGRSLYDHGVSTFWRDKCKINQEKVMNSEWYKILAEERKNV